MGVKEQALSLHSHTAGQAVLFQQFDEVILSRTAQRPKEFKECTTDVDFALIDFSLQTRPAHESLK
jgi:hypothetical protein